MDGLLLAVNQNAPKMGPLRESVRVLGQDMLSPVIKAGPNLPEADAIRAWLYEMKHGEWGSLDALADAFPNVNLTEPPKAVFRLSSAPISIETLFDLSNDIVLITAISVAHSSNEEESARDRPS